MIDRHGWGDLKCLVVVFVRGVCGFCIWIFLSKTEWWRCRRCWIMMTTTGCVVGRRFFFFFHCSRFVFRFSLLARSGDRIPRQKFIVIGGLGPPSSVAPSVAPSVGRSRRRRFAVNRLAWILSSTLTSIEMSERSEPGGRSAPQYPPPTAAERGSTPVKRRFYEKLMNVSCEYDLDWIWTDVSN